MRRRGSQRTAPGKLVSLAPTRPILSAAFSVPSRIPSVRFTAMSVFLQIKQAEASVLEEPLGPSGFSNHGERVVTGQRLMQATSDIFLGWLNVDAEGDGQGDDYYARQLKDWKASAEIEQMGPAAMATYGTLCGWTLARAHARSGDRIAIAAYLGKGDRFDRAMVEFSKAYAEQNERDYRALQAAVDSGRLAAQTGL